MTRSDFQIQRSQMPTSIKRRKSSHALSGWPLRAPRLFLLHTWPEFRMQA